MYYFETTNFPFRVEAGKFEMVIPKDDLCVLFDGTELYMIDSRISNHLTYSMFFWNKINIIYNNISILVYWTDSTHHGYIL